MNDAFRDWRPDEWFDSAFLRNVAASDRKKFTQALRPLSDDASGKVQQALFAGIKKPWHYVDTTGWMRRILHEGFFRTEKPVDAIRTRIAWSEDDVVLVVPNHPTVYATTWGDFLSYLQRRCIYTDNSLVCHPIHRDVLLFWEDYYPYFGKRGKRKLFSPPLNG